MQSSFKKPLSWLMQESVTDDAHSLKRSLSAFQLVTLGLGVIIGAGLFSLTGLAAANNAGPAVTLSFIVSAVGCCFAGLCYAEFSSMIPVAGSAYTYAYATMGEVLAWIIGWDLVLEFSVGGATVAISWSNYLTEFLAGYHLYLPPQLVRSPFELVTLANGSQVHAWFNLPALLVVVAMSLLLMRGTRGSAIWNAIVVSLKVGVVLVFIALGWQYINPANYHPYIPANTGTFGEYGWSGILRGAGVIFFVYLGFDMVSTAAQEARNPQRNMPIGILGSLALCTVLFLLFSHVLTGLAPYQEFKDSAAPVAVALKHTPYTWLAQAVILAIIVGYTSVILVDLLAQSRVFYAMSRDGLIPPAFSKVHSRFRTPFKGNIVTGIFAALLAGLLPLDILGELVSIGTLAAFTIVCIGVMVLRVRAPNARRPFRTPLVWFTAPAGVFMCVFMMAFLPVDTWLRLAAWTAIGLAIYFLYSAKHAHPPRYSIQNLPAE